jgi:hypothetical protein
MVKTFCGVPQIKLKTVTAVDDTNLSLNFLEWAPDGVTDFGTAKIAAQALERGKKFTPPDGESSPLLTQVFKEKTDPQKLLPGTIPLLGTKNVTAISAAIATQRGLINTYKADLAKYYTAYQAYADSFIAILKENWNDYGMNVIRTEDAGNFWKKNLTAAAVVPTEPAAFTGDFLKTSATGELSPAWEAGAGSPTKGSIVMDKTYGVAGALKNFGVFGQGTTGTGYYSNWRSELWHYGRNNDAAAAQKYGADICPPKYIFLNVVYTKNAETGSTTKTSVNMANDATGAGTLTLSFASVASQTVDIFEPKLSHMEMAAEVKAGMPATTNMDALGAYYTANGAMMFGVAASAAALASTLY